MGIQKKKSATGPVTELDRSGRVSVNVSAVDADTGQDIRRSETATPTAPLAHAAGAPVGRVKYSSGIRLSKSFNSASVEVGVELPWVIRPGASGAEDVAAGLKFAADMVEDEMARQAPEVEKLLVALARKRSGTAGD